MTPKTPNLSDFKKDELINIVSSFKDRKIAVVGDVMLDKYVWGNAERISPEAPVLIVDVQEESKRLGGAANTACNLASLGAIPIMFGVIGNDQAGQDVCTMLEHLRCDYSNLVVSDKKITTQKTRLLARNHQIVRVDREIKGRLPSNEEEKIADTIESNAKDYSGIIISDYGKGVVSELLCNRLEQLYLDGTIGDIHRPILIDPKKENFNIYKGATIIKPNRSEAELASGIKIRTVNDAIKAADILKQKWNSKYVMITLSEDGMVVAGDESPVVAPAISKQVFDVSGAGDTVSAVFTLALSSGANLMQAAVLANLAAGIVIGEVGTVAIGAAELLNAIDDY